MLGRLELGKRRYAELMQHHGRRFSEGDILVITLYDSIEGKRVKDWVAVARTREEADDIQKQRFSDVST